MTRARDAKPQDGASNGEAGQGSGEAAREPSVESLMARFRKTGDAAAFDMLVSRLLMPALVVARQMLHDHALAEDAAQEAFLRVVRNRRGYVPSRSFAPWFYTILRNVCTDMLRSRQRQSRLTEELAARAAGASEQDSSVGARAEAAATLRVLLDRLPAGERAVLELRVRHDLPLSEVAAALGISHEAAKKRAQRALRRLRRRSGRD